MRLAALVLFLGHHSRVGSGFVLRNRFATSVVSKLASSTASEQLRRSDAGVEFSDDEIDKFSHWLDGQRTSAEDSPTLFVVDAGDDVDTAIGFSGVAWQVLADLSTNCFGDGEAEVIVHFPGLKSLGCQVFDVFSEIFAAAKLGEVGGSDSTQPGGGSSGFSQQPLVELARLEVATSPVPGPALVLRCLRARNEGEVALALMRRDASRAAAANQEGCLRAVKSFVSRVVVGEVGLQHEGEGSAGSEGGAGVGGKGACPYTASTDLAATGLSKQGVTPGPVAYRFEACSDAVDAIAACWRSFAEVLNTPEEELSTTLLSLPAVAPPPPASPSSSATTQEESQQRFLAFIDLVSRSLLLYGADQLLGLVYFHPLYDRDAVKPKDDASYGNIPPLSWLPSMVAKSGLGTDAEVAAFSTDPAKTACSNYQRRAPLLVVNILRASQLTAATGGLSVVDLEVPALAGGQPPTRTVKASGIRTYARNALKLASEGEQTLLLELADEINDAYPE